MRTAAVVSALVLALVVCSPALAWHRHHGHGHHRHHTIRHRGRVVAHPPGCPWRLFCGCGVAWKVFGKPVVSGGLALAANWRRFESALPSPGMVAWRVGHVFYILRYLGNGTVLAWDPNSGHHLTRVHRVSLRGYHVVNPHRRRHRHRHRLITASSADN